MEKILLVEPNYKNKYPPIGLMKISTYYKKKGDFVEFRKGLIPSTEVLKYNKVLITTLFTFDFDMCIKTIRYYIAILGIDNVFVGGIAATIMPENFLKEIPELRLLTGQLTSSEVLGYDDAVNIDLLELDYDILWDIDYDYPASDSYFIYTSRGCPRKCAFCAVKTLEPNFYDCDNLNYQISSVDTRFGIKKQLLIMDNNILYSNKFVDAINELKDIGFGVGNNKIKKNNNMKYYLLSLENRIKDGRKYECLLKRIKKEFLNIKFSRVKKIYHINLQTIIKKIKSNAPDLVPYICKNDKYIVDFFNEYNFHKITRYVDFNQGLDARLFTDDKAKMLSEIAIKPCRIAFDSLSVKDDYFHAMELSVKHGIKYFSNYLLYNYKEKPEDLWMRLYLNIQFCLKHNEIFLFSFPMKYAAIDHTDRSYVGSFWNKKFLRAINVILNVTSGVVAKEKDFFIRAFGHSKKEFIEILTMPDEFIRYRDFYDANGFSVLWQKCYSILSLKEKEQLLSILDEMVGNEDVLIKKYSQNIDNILVYYSLKRRNIESNPLYYKNLFNKLETKLLKKHDDELSSTNCELRIAVE